MIRCDSSTDLSDALDRDGFCVAPFVLDAAECDALADRIGALEGAGNRSLLRETWCRDLAERIRIDLCETLSDMIDMTPVLCTLFHKDEDRNWLVPWHQDRSLPFDPRLDDPCGVTVREKDGISCHQPPAAVLEGVVAVRVHLDSSHAANGPLRLLAGTHRRGTLEARRIDGIRKTATERVIEIARGGLLIMRPLTLHASSKSVSGDSRRVLHYVYRPGTSRQGGVAKPNRSSSPSSTRSC